MTIATLFATGLQNGIPRSFLKLVFKNLVEKIPEREALAIPEISDRLADFDRYLSVVSILCMKTR